MLLVFERRDLLMLKLREVEVKMILLFWKDYRFYSKIRKAI